MHADELEIDERLVRRLLDDQFPRWAELPLRKVEPVGTVNAVFRLGDEYSIRLARREGPKTPGGRGIPLAQRAYSESERTIKNVILSSILLKE